MPLLLTTLRRMGLMKAEANTVMAAPEAAVDAPSKHASKHANYSLHAWKWPATALRGAD